AYYGDMTSAVAVRQVASRWVALRWLALRWLALRQVALRQVALRQGPVLAVLLVTALAGSLAGSLANAQAATLPLCAAPTDVATFPDDALTSAVREALELQPGDPIPCDRLARLNRIRAQRAGISDL